MPFRLSALKLTDYNIRCRRVRASCARMRSQEHSFIHHISSLYHVSTLSRRCASVLYSGIPVRLVWSSLKIIVPDMRGMPSPCVGGYQARARAALRIMDE